MIKLKWYTWVLLAMIPFGVLQTCNQKTVEIRQPKDPFVKPNEKPIRYDWRNGVYIYESDSLVKDPIDGVWKKEADLNKKTTIDFLTLKHVLLAPYL